MEVFRPDYQLSNEENIKKAAEDSTGLKIG